MIDPPKTSAEMSPEVLSRWLAFTKSLEIIFDHAEKHGIDIDTINIDTRKIVKEYIDPMSGDILHDIENGVFV